LPAHELLTVWGICPRAYYDLLGTRPDDDAEALKAAFRKAAKANHPDLHAGDPYAAARFRQIAEAYEILRDADRRANYDRLLRFERERLRWTSKGTVYYLMHSIVFDAVTAVGLAIILAGGYMTYAHFSKIPAEARASQHITSGPVPKAAALNSDVVKTTSAFAVIIDQAGPKSVEERPDQNAGTEMLDRESAQLVKVLSSPEESDGVGKSSPADLATSDNKRDMKRRDTQDTDPNDVKISNTKLPETKMPRKPRIAARLQATGRITFEQASLENRNTCSESQSCSRDAPPLFGVGF
jgi:curved DNA-binding protein CbpA